MGCLIATNEDDDDDDGGGATGNEVNNDGNDGDGTERRNNQIEAMVAAGGNWLEGRASCIARMPGEDNNLKFFKQT
jgi:hypothetical protein